MKNKKITLIIIGILIVLALGIRLVLFLSKKTNQQVATPIVNQTTTPTSENQPVVGLANPASTNCVAKGG